MEAHPLRRHAPSPGVALTEAGAALLADLELRRGVPATR